MRWLRSRFTPCKATLAPPWLWNHPPISVRRSQIPTGSTQAAKAPPTTARSAATHAVALRMAAPAPSGPSADLPARTVVADRRRADPLVPMDAIGDRLGIEMSAGSAEVPAEKRLGLRDVAHNPAPQILARASVGAGTQYDMQIMRLSRMACASKDGS